MDQLDSDLIRQQLAGESEQRAPLVFAVKEGGKLYCELNWQGVKEAVRVCAERGIARLAIGSVPPQLTETREFCQFTVQAVDGISGQVNWGVAREYKSDNPFAVQIALTKAQRNALRALIPPEVRSELIKQAVDAGQVSAVSLAPEKTKQPTPKQLDTIGKGVADTGTDLKKLLEYYKVGALEALTRDQASDAIRILGLKGNRNLRGSS